MKNLKLVSYQEWSRVYESLNKDSAATQSILESRLMNLNEGAKFEQTGVINLGSKTGEATTELYGGIDKITYDVELNQADNQLVWETAIRLFDSIPNLSVLWEEKINTASKDTLVKLAVVQLIIAGIGNSVGTDYVFSKLIDDPELIGKLKIKATLDKTFNIPGKDGVVYADPKINIDGSLDMKPTSRANKPSYLCGLLNTENLVNWTNNSFSQSVDLSKNIENQDWFKIRPYTSAKVKEQSALYLFSNSASSELGSPTPTPTPQQVSNTAKGVAIPWKELDFDYDEDGVVINEDYPEIISLVKQIISEIAPSEIITKLQLTSIVKPMWQGQATSGTGTGEPVGQAGSVKLTDKTFNTEKTALGNQWLAWRRGSEVARYLYSYLEGKIKENAIEVIWKIENITAANSNISYSIVTKTNSAAPIANSSRLNTALGVGRITTNSTIPIYRYKISFDGSVLANAVPGKLKKITGLGAKYVAYEDLKVGYSIKYKGMTDGEVDDKSKEIGKVKSIDGDGKITIETESGRIITINKSRFISSEEKSKSGVAVEE